MTDLPGHRDGSIPAGGSFPIRRHARCSTRQLLGIAPRY